MARSFPGYRTALVLALTGLWFLAAPVAIAQSAASPAPLRASSAPVKATPTKPLWVSLTADQRQALAPLAASWDTLPEGQKRKWIAMVINYGKMPPPEQARLHSRMSEWIALSPQQRVQARLNFGETQQLSGEEKKAKWEAYQALPAEEKSRLAASAAARPPTTAAPVKPVAPQKLATMPKSSPELVRPPRIVSVPAGDSVEPAH